MSKLIKKIAQKITVDYYRLSIVENPDGFLTQDAVRHLLIQECGIEVVVGSNLQLRIQYELHYKSDPEKRYLYVCTNRNALLADMKREAYLCSFSVSDVFPLFADKTLVRKQPYEVLDILYEQVGMQNVPMQECNRKVSTIVLDLKDKKRRSAAFFNEQLLDIDIDWTNPASTISQISRILANAIKEGVYEGIAPNIDKINETFQRWIDAEYFATLQSNPLLKAKGVNKILPHLSAKHSKNEKVALLVVDGFAFWQYILLKDFLKKVHFSIEDGCTLAWMPSITMLSRQAIFRGSDPLQDYKQNPENEMKLWFDYWEQQGFGSYEVQYIYDTDVFAINEVVKRLAVVTVEMDKKMHSSSDYKDLCSLTENWCPRIVDKIEAIINAGYTLYLTTDHGSLLSHGWRTLTSVEKVFLYEDGSRGKRHLIYNNKEEEERFYKENPDLSMVKHDNWLSIRDNSCFAKENTTMITHGGSHFLEMVVPLIKILK